MVSRRKILSRSRDDLNLDQTFTQQEEEEDIWFQKDKLYKEHIQEVLDKWTQIDDEIWAKVIVFERNRRVAKAYARAPVLTINGSDDGFDGMRIGLCGFDNPMRDQKTDEMKRVIGQGVKIKMDDAGNILIRRYAKSNVYVKSTASSPNEETSIGAEILKLPNQALESEKIVKLFDMKKFQSNVNRELRRAYPDRRRLETQCLSSVAFVKSENDILECPIWVLIVNVVAMDMLKSKLPPVQRPIVDIKNRPRIPIPDEDPYSVAGNGSGGSSGSSGFGSGHQAQLHPQQQLGKHLNGNGGGHVAATREQLLMQTQQLAHKRSEKPPKLPPRDNIYSHDLIPKPDYDDIDLETRIKLSRGKSDKGKDNKKYDDPYYCGLRARVPNFVKSGKPIPAQVAKDQRDGNGNNIGNGGISTLSQKKTSMIHNHLGGMHPHHIQQQQQLMAAAAAAHAAQHHHAGHQREQQQQHHQIWQTRSYESGIGIYKQGGPNAAHQSHKSHALQMQMHQQLQMQMQQQQQQPQSLPTDLTATTATATTKTQSTANQARSHQPHPHLHPHSNPHAHPHHRLHRHVHVRCERHAHLQQQHSASLQSVQHQPQQQQHVQQQQPYYDNLEDSVARRVTRRHSTRRSEESSACNCVSCYALAPLCGAVPPPRPQRSLSQQQLRRHQRLSGSLVEQEVRPAVVKWCSESDVSVLELEPTEPTNERYDDCYDYDDFDMAFDLDDDLGLTENIPRRKGTETVDMYMDRSHLRQLQAPAVLRTKSQSTESFFEQPNEEGSLYMYGGRKRIAVKAPSATNIYDRVRGTIDYSDRGRSAAGAKRGQCHKKTQLPAPSWRGGKRQEQAQNADKRQRYDNATNGNSHGNGNNSSNNQHKRQLTNAKQDNEDMLKSKNYFNSKNKSIAAAAANAAASASAATTAAAKATAVSANIAATSGGGGAEPGAGASATGVAGGKARGGGVATMAPPLATSPAANNATAVSKAPSAPPPTASRTGRSASRLDISDMESIYGYLKPRKPRSLSLKKIQILDY
ncbi:uncharacterized protein LOC6608732 isoform X1 [Drosophila sechellia]|uniref:uncharacterized protein LOC6608732 isoform X1 n=1 Tax=Drosophila sechellia TaxID=7238 RepID=UPI0013DDA22A|nr:uncharacterized protein LOC6608732 isoform X1 [Drosophila sechellia]XP_032571239.1 uncharacterized protein LOC6608732 isoform X1 [Drosophila sechellia]